MSSRGKLTDVLLISGIGIAMTLGYAFLDISFGERTVTSRETWHLGVAQPYVLAGVILIVLAALWYRGVSWVRWPILLWAPVAILCGAIWAESQGIGEVNLLFVVTALLIGSIWVWGALRIVFPK